jgi:hypothetical protein
MGVGSGVSISMETNRKTSLAKLHKIRHFHNCLLEQSSFLLRMDDG